MSDNTFTPGPWGILVGESGPVVFSGKTGASVAFVHRPLIGEGRLANAHLIAAAPDLYAELHKLDPANPALAKARGEA